MSTWSELSTKDRAAFIQMMAKEGISSLDEMEEYYNNATQEEPLDEEYSEEEPDEYFPMEASFQQGNSSLSSGDVTTGRQYYIKPDGSIGIKEGNSYAFGGFDKKIRIKKKNRGKFTALKKRTGHSATWFKQHGTPAQKKMATFELNARKWKHDTGGSLNLAPYAMGGPINPNNYLPSFVGRRQPLPAVRFDTGGFEFPKWAEKSSEDYDNKYDRITNARYQTAFDTLSNRGYNRIDADRLANILAAQSINETGWLDNDKNNNYAGYLFKGKKMNFGSPEEFWDYHINNLNNRWPGWDKANNIDEYFSIINHTDLGLTTKDAYDAYMKNHRNDPVYIYAPDWQNTNYLGKMKSISNKMNKYLKSKGPLFGK